MSEAHQPEKYVRATITTPIQPGSALHLMLEMIAVELVKPDSQSSLLNTHSKLPERCDRIPRSSSIENRKPLK